MARAVGSGKMLWLSVADFEAAILRAGGDSIHGCWPLGPSSTNSSRMGRIIEALLSLGRGGFWVISVSCDLYVLSEMKIFVATYLLVAYLSRAIQIVEYPPCPVLSISKPSSTGSDLVY